MGDWWGFWIFVANEKAWFFGLGVFGVNKHTNVQVGVL